MTLALPALKDPRARRVIRAPTGTISHLARSLVQPAALEEPVEREALAALEE